MNANEAPRASILAHTRTHRHSETHADQLLIGGKRERTTSPKFSTILFPQCHTHIYHTFIVHLLLLLLLHLFLKPLSIHVIRDLCLSFPHGLPHAHRPLYRTFTRPVEEAAAAVAGLVAVAAAGLVAGRNRHNRLRSWLAEPRPLGLLRQPPVHSRGTRRSTAGTASRRAKENAQPTSVPGKLIRIFFSKTRTLWAAYADAGVCPAGL
jgi:hypothetical protein